MTAKRPYTDLVGTSPGNLLTVATAQSLFAPIGVSVAANSWGAISGPLSAQSDLFGVLTALNNGLADKAPNAHSHAIGSVTGLQDALNNRAVVGHNHDTLYAALNHVHGINGITGLQAALDLKADDGHTHTTFAGSTAGFVPPSAGNPTTFLRADGVWATPAGSGASSAFNIDGGDPESTYDSGNIDGGNPASVF